MNFYMNKKILIIMIFSSFNTVFADCAHCSCKKNSQAVEIEQGLPPSDEECEMAPVAGLEPATHGLTVRCSTG